MIDYGTAPASDEIEVILFGPGYGEAVALHVGGGIWVLIDSCIDPDTKESATAAYLDRIGVKPEQVRAIVASHWHDDHVKGISQLVGKYSGADFVLSSIFNEKEARSLLSAFSGESSGGLSRGTKELFSVIKQRATVSHAHHKSIVLQEVVDGRTVLITALSPLQAAVTRSIAHLAKFLPCKGDPIMNAPSEIRENFESVALHVDLGNDAILLGADLENHAAYGWAAVVADSWSGKRPPATAYKVAHHGSRTGDAPEIWETLLRRDPAACLTPYNLCDLRLPTEDDKSRLKKRTPHTFISSASSRRPQMDSRQLKRLEDVCQNVRLVELALGAVRLRKSRLAKSWSVELFGAAKPL